MAHALTVRQPPFRPPEGWKPQAGVERAEELQGGVGPVDRHEAVGSVVDGIDGRVACAGREQQGKEREYRKQFLHGLLCGGWQAPPSVPPKGGKRPVRGRDVVTWCKGTHFFRHGQIVGDKTEGDTGKRLERPVLSV